MQKLVRGIHHFQSQIFSEREELFRSLAAGQKPLALFITCADSRVVPNLITQTDPGELFIARNAGNIVPPSGAGATGESATVEYALAALEVEHIIVCGHTLCGAMKALLNPESVKDLPSVKCWLQHAEATRRIMQENYKHLDGDAKLTATVQENVLVQLDNLRTHPLVAARLSAGKLKLHAWVYKIETGRVFSFDHESGQFVPLTGEVSSADAEESGLASLAVKVGFDGGVRGGSTGGRKEPKPVRGRVARVIEPSLGS